MTISRQTQLLTDLFAAYFAARKHKRNTLPQLQFEVNYESNIIQLREDIINNRYTIWPSTCFLIADPVVREIFAADFRDRVVHHLLYNYLYSLYDKYFIYDSYSCRIWKWTYLGVKRVDHFIRSCSQNYTRDCYILKLDIQWFFMSIDKEILRETITSCHLDRNEWNEWSGEISEISPLRSVPSLQSKWQVNSHSEWSEAKRRIQDTTLISGSFTPFRMTILKLLHQTIFHDPTKNYHFVGSRKWYKTLPKDKNLFHCRPNAGLPIGNITSQLFANVYLDGLDKYIKYTLGCEYCGRYVDDFVIVHQDKDFLLSIIPQIKSFLQEKHKLTLHPKKIYLQHYSKWVQFLWAIIKPHRTYINKRTIWNWKKSIYKHKNKHIDNVKLFASTNSYLWLCKHHKSYRVSRKIWDSADNWFREKYGLIEYMCSTKK